MPAVTYGQFSRWKTTSKARFDNVDHKYNYPNDLNLKPGSELHTKIISQIIERATNSASVMTRRHQSWNDMDKKLTSYIWLDEEEVDVEDEDDRKPTSIVYPYIYAILETMLGYLAAVFLNRPMFMYEGVSPEDTLGAIMMEKIIDLHSMRTKTPLSIYTMLRDSLTYGFGVGEPYWEKRRGKILVREDDSIIGPFGMEFKDYKKSYKEGIIFEGNTLENLDPYRCFPDVNVPIHKPQDMEFFGWLEESGYMKLLREERDSKNMFNVKYIQNVNDKTSFLSSDAAAREVKTGGKQRPNYEGSKPVDVINMFVDLIPKEWELGSKTYPERWFFSVASDAVIIRAMPIGLAHGMMPIVVAAPGFDGYSQAPISKLETMFGMQKTLDFLFNSHVTNVRKAINDSIVYDPYQLSTTDLKSSKPGKLIRTRRPAWGKGVKDTYGQLIINDITRGHIGDSFNVMNGMQQIAGVDESSMGMLRQGGPERLTKAEFSGTRAGNFSRLELMAMLISYQAMQDLGYFFASHTQQLMSKPVYVATTGRWQEVLANEYGVNQTRMMVSPEDINVEYDLIPRDGSIPGGNYSDVWLKLFELMANNPELQQRFDIVRIFKHIARNGGAKNVDDFERMNFSVKPEDEIEKAVDAGNAVPLNEGLESGLV